MILLTSRALLLSISLAAKVAKRSSPASSRCSDSSGRSSTHYCSTAAYLAAQGQHPAAAASAAGSSSSSGRADADPLFAAALEVLPFVHEAPPGGALLTDGFLEVCELTAPIIESFGPAFSMVHRDITRNIERIRARKATDPERFRLLFPIVEDEVARRDDRHSQSCTKAVLWLKRGMEFMLAIMRRLLELPEDAAMADVVQEQYAKTLRRWHGMLCSSAFSVALAFVPNRATFLDRLAGGRYTPETAAEMAAYVDSFGNLLAEVHSWLDTHQLDDPAKV
ncbi:hypothetical protein Rsub_06243 [Raphidocelis subcapitata]|uniref:Glycolipid transfer protein domain-containing protein n=1 Tax=Raphidocelis subcapitata TaxID=307507 RepID=A0A2V0P287_9CHLO|nr:hypothetical protein Rsub_06243 [Raphidocelis subcapitata]|eukprot:GBF93994.1 hypothetical protein Rsub_06243 [Raphidocelis subcapitata]